MKFQTRLAIGCVLGTQIATYAQAAETVTYTYDAQGRLIRLSKTGTGVNGEVVQYEHDKADNRKRVIVTGS